MRLQVDGIEEIEITDPAGLCNPPAPPPPIPSNPMPGILPGLPSPPPPFRSFPPGSQPQPMVPTPIRPFRPPISPFRPQPERGEPFAGEPKWGVGGPMIQQAGKQVDPEKWEENWQAGRRGEDPDGD